MRRFLIVFLLALSLSLPACAATNITLSPNDSRAGAGATVDGNIIRIAHAGTYTLRGTLTQGQIYVEASGDQPVILMLDGVEISNDTEAALYVEDAGRVELVLVAGSENRFASGALPDETALRAGADAETSGGAIHARDDLTISGEGTLTVIGGIKNGIHCTNRLTVSGGNIHVTALNIGLKGKDGLTVSGGDITILSGGDGMQSDDVTGEGYGVIDILGGTMDITSYGDGIQAETALTVAGGNLTITTVGEEKKSTSTNRRADPWGGRGWDQDEETNAESLKGLKSLGSLVITGGMMTITTEDDAIHADGSIAISGGDMTLSAGDDGVHADNAVEISGGIINILTSYEGIEANQLLITGGDTTVRATDDGVNAYGGQNGFGMGGMGNRGGFGSSGGQSSAQQESDEPMPLVRITGGSLIMNADGDGLDSNGDLVIEGGLVIVHGPSQSMNGAIDTGTENGGECLVHGGTVLAVGSSGMAESFGRESTQVSFNLRTSRSFTKGDVLTIRSAAGDVLFTCEMVKSGNSVVFSAPELQIGDTITVEIGGASQSITLNSVSTSTGGSQRRW